LKAYNDYTTYFKSKFSQRVQKIALDAGFSCPNRDGSKGIGGCTYCNNQTFNPFYCTPQKSITQQLDEGIRFFAAKYQTQKYLAYFQAYSNTFAGLEILEKLYNEALAHPAVIGLVIATRPDCIDDKKLNFIAQLAEKHYIVVEFGVESCNNETLKLINRCHTFEDSVDAIQRTVAKGITTGIHLILGLPNESRETILHHADLIAQLPVETLKLHQLQIIKGTKMAEQFAQNPEWFHYYDVDEYIDLAIDFVERLNPKVIIERFISESPVNMLISPRWNGIKNFEFVSKLERRMRERNAFQARLFGNQK